MLLLLSGNGSPVVMRSLDKPNGSDSNPWSRTSDVLICESFPIWWFICNLQMLISIYFLFFSKQLSHLYYITNVCLFVTFSPRFSSFSTKQISHKIWKGHRLYHWNKHIIIIQKTKIDKNFTGSAPSVSTSAELK